MDNILSLISLLFFSSPDNPKPIPTWLKTGGKIFPRQLDNQSSRFSFPTSGPVVNMLGLVFVGLVLVIVDQDWPDDKITLLAAGLVLGTICGDCLDDDITVVAGGMALVAVGIDCPDNRITFSERSGCWCASGSNIMLIVNNCCCTSLVLLESLTNGSGVNRNDCTTWTRLLTLCMTVFPCQT